MRLAMLAENEIVRRVKALMRLRDEIKAVGQRFGSDSVVTKRVFSAAEYDIQVDYIINQVKIVEVTFTPSNPDDPNTSLVYRMDFISTTSGTDYVDDMEVWRLKPVNGVQKWRIYLTGNAPPNEADWWRAKFYFYASGNGQFTATLI
jgi:hypothetical protein